MYYIFYFPDMRECVQTAVCIYMVVYFTGLKVPRILEAVLYLIYSSLTHIL